MILHESLIFLKNIVSHEIIIYVKDGNKSQYDT